MLRIAGVLTVLLVLGCCTEIFPKTTQEKSPHPIFIPFEQNCSENKNKNLSHETISQIQKAHFQWLKNPTAPEGHRANFCEADLSDVDFHMAMLVGANFTKAKLQNVQLERANLSRANFSEAQLQGVNLDNAMLHLAIFQRAVFHDASLQNAMLYQAKLQGADLRNVKGLTQIQINMACLDTHTKLPRGLSHPKPCF